MLKHWRLEAVHAFYQVSLHASACTGVTVRVLQSDFFRMPPQSLSAWTRVINHVMARDPTALTEFLRNAVKALAATLLASASSRARENDVARARYIKRLAFVLFAGSLDQYVASLPGIQVRLGHCCWCMR
jgi:hypothetical protein